MNLVLFDVPANEGKLSDIACITDALADTVYQRTVDANDRWHYINTVFADHFAYGIALDEDEMERIQKAEQSRQAWSQLARIVGFHHLAERVAKGDKF